MKVIYSPSTAKSINEQLNLNASMMFMAKAVRKYQQFPPLSIEQCEKCEWRARHYHHIKPVWVNILEWLLGQNPQTYQDLLQLERHFYVNAKSFAVWHNRDNLMLLCAKCHKKVQSDVDSQYKAYFEANYPLVFGYRQLAKQIAFLERVSVTACDA